MDLPSIQPIQHFEPLTAALATYLGGIGPLVWGTLIALRLWWRDHRRSRRARRATAMCQDLVEGETIVSGTVELAAEGTPLRVEVDQEGQEWDGSGGWAHAWTDVDRRVEVAPFYLRHASGALVRVEPTKDKAVLMDPLKGLIWVDLHRRIRTAELVPGGWIVVRGRLHRGASPPADVESAGDAQWILGPPTKGHMAFSSTELERQSSQRARLYGVVALIHAALLLWGIALVRDYFFVAFAGETVEATVVSAELRQENDEGESFPHLAIRLAAPQLGPSGLVQRLDGQLRRAVKPGMRVPVQWVAIYPGASQVGRGATVGLDGLSWLIPLHLLGLLVVGLSWFFGPRHYMERRPVTIELRGKLPRTDEEREEDVPF